MWDQTDSPEIPDRGKTSKIPRPCFGVSKYLDEITDVDSRGQEIADADNRSEKSYPCEVADVEHELLAGVAQGGGGEGGAGVLRVGGLPAVAVCRRLAKHKNHHQRFQLTGKIPTFHWLWGSITH